MQRPCLTTGVLGDWEFTTIFGTLVSTCYSVCSHILIFIGGLLSAGITYGTARMDGTWAWRLPSAMQGFFSILCILILPFIPESPRWLIHRNRHEEAIESISLACSNGDHDDPVVLAQYKEIVDTLNFEKESGETLYIAQMVKNKGARKRTLLNVSVAIISMLSGNNIISYYLGTMLDNAGITDSTTQLQIVSGLPYSSNYFLSNLCRTSFLTLGVLLSASAVHIF